MFNEEEGIIHYEVESDDSIEVVEEMPQQSIEISQNKDPCQTLEKQPLVSKTQELPEKQVIHNPDTNTNPLYEEEQRADEEQILRRVYGKMWKKTTLKKLERITSKFTDEDLEKETKDQIKKKVQFSSVRNPNEIICQGAKNNQQISIPLHKQKEFQLMVEHCAGRPDFMEAIIAEQQDKEQQLMQQNDDEGGNIVKKPLIVPPKSGLKKGPGRKKATVTFDESAKIPGQIQYIKTSVIPPKQTPPVQPTEQLQNMISKFQEYRESQAQQSSSFQNQYTQRQESQIPLGQGQWYNSKADKRSQPFQPPHAGSNPKELPTINSVQMISQSQAAQQSLPHKFLNMNQNLPRRELSPKRTRDMITEQYTSAYQVDRPPQLPSRQQPIFQQQQIDKNITYELNQAKKQKESLGKSEQQSLVKIQAKLQESVKRQSVPMPTVEEDDMDFGVMDDDVVESQAFLDFKRAGKLIEPAPPQNIQYWQIIHTNMDIPSIYYMNGKFTREASINVPTDDPYEIMKLLLDPNICKYICQTSNKGQCMRIDEDILESFITSLIYLLYIQILGIREIKRVRFDFILDNATFRHICKELRIDEFEDYSYIFEKTAQNFQAYYHPEEFLILDTPIFNQNHYVEGLISLSDGMKGYILDFIYGIDQKKIVHSLQKYQGRHHKLFFGQQIVSLDLMAELKLKQFGSLGKVVAKQTLLTQDQIVQIKQNSQKGQSTQFISNDFSNVMLIYGQRQQHLQQIEGLVSSYADFTLLQKKDANTDYDVNKPIIIFLYDKIKTTYDKKASTYAFSQIPEQDFNQHLEIFLQLLYSIIFNANMLHKMKLPINVTNQKDKSKQQFVDYVRSLLHSLYLRCYKRKGITQFPSSHTLEGGNPVPLNCTECGQPSLFICKECSFHQQQLIPICRNKNDACLKTHEYIFVSQPKFTGPPKKLTNKLAIVQLEFYRSQIKQSGDIEVKKAIPLLEEALHQLENQDPDEEINVELQTLMASLQMLVQQILQKPNILVNNKQKSAQQSEPVIISQSQQYQYQSGNEKSQTDKNVKLSEPNQKQDSVPQFQRLQGKVIQERK